MTSLHVVVLMVAYLLGSVPSAVIVSRRAARVEIRDLGDHNMGARTGLSWGQPRWWSRSLALLT